MCEWLLPTSTLKAWGRREGAERAGAGRQDSRAGTGRVHQKGWVSELRKAESSVFQVWIWGLGSNPDSAAS